MIDITINALRIIRPDDNSSTQIYVDDELAYDYRTAALVMPLEWIVEYIYYRYFTFSEEVECSDKRRLRVLCCLKEDYSDIFCVDSFDFKNMQYSQYQVGDVEIRVNYHTKKGGSVIKREYTTLSEPYPGAKVKKTFISTHPIHVRPPKDEIFKVLEL